MDTGSWKTLKDKALSAVNNAAQGVDHQLTVTKLRLQVKHDQDVLDEEYQRLGTICYEKLSQTGSVSATSSDIAAILSNIVHHQQALKASEKAVDESRAPDSQTKCSACGAEITNPQAKFCSSCGSPIQ